MLTISKLFDIFNAHYFFSSVHLSLMKSQARYRPRVFLPTPPSTFFNTIKFRNLLFHLTLYPSCFLTPLSGERDMLRYLTRRRKCFKNYYSLSEMDPSFTYLKARHSYCSLNCSTMLTFLRQPNSRNEPILY